VRERLEAKWPADCFATLAGDVLSAPQDNGLLLRSVAVRWVHDHYEEVGDDGTE
jgi:hypothetical protein